MLQPPTPLACQAQESVEGLCKSQETRAGTLSLKRRTALRGKSAGPARSLHTHLLHPGACWQAFRASSCSNSPTGLPALSGAPCRPEWQDKAAPPQGPCLRVCGWLPRPRARLGDWPKQGQQAILPSDPSRLSACAPLC